MIISELKIGIANKKIASLQRKRVFAVEGKPVRSVGVLLDDTTISSSENFVELKRSLGLEEEDFVIITSQKSKPDNPENGMIYCTSKDLNWKGNLTCEKGRNFIQREFDLLVCFNGDKSPLVRFLTSASNAALKIGRIGEKSGLAYDISVLCEVDEADLFVEEVKKYLGILNKIRK